MTVVAGAWDEAKHPRDPGGEGGGQFVDSLVDALLGPEPPERPKAEPQPVKDKAYFLAKMDEYNRKSYRMEYAEEVPVEEVAKFMEYDRRSGPAGERTISENDPYYEALKEHIAKNGINEPIFIDYNPETGMGHVSEGHHRIEAARDVGLETVPVVIYESRRTGRRSRPLGPFTGEILNKEDVERYGDAPRLPEYGRPSDFGIVSRGPSLRASAEPSVELYNRAQKHAVAKLEAHVPELQRVYERVFVEGMFWAADQLGKLTAAAGWDESKHPRDPGGEGGGEFISTGASGSGGSGKWERRDDGSYALEGWTISRRKFGGSGQNKPFERVNVKARSGWVVKDPEGFERATGSTLESAKHSALRQIEFRRRNDSEGGLTAAGAPDPDSILNPETAALTAKATTEARRKALLQFLLDLGVNLDLSNPMVKQLVFDLGRFAGRLMVPGLQQAVSQSLRESYETGLSVPDAADQLREVGLRQAPWRAEMMARTDLNGLANGGSVAGAQLIFPTGDVAKRWLSSHDDRVRPDHVEADGQVVPLEQAFQVGDDLLQFPGDPSGSDAETCNCRCTVVYVPLERALAAAGFDPAKHPHRPAGDSTGGQWASKTERDLAVHEQRVRDLIATVEKAAREGKIRKDDTYYSVTSPYRRSENAISQVLALMDATGGDIVATARALDSQTAWQGGWYAAGDEWNMASALGGSGAQAKVTSEIASEQASYTEDDIKAFEARRRWHQEEFRKRYPEGLDVYRGVTGKPATRPYAEAVAQYELDEGRLNAEWMQRYQASTFEQQNEMGFRREYGKSQPVQAPQYQLSSWTTSSVDASDFAYGATKSGRRGSKHGVVLRSHITADDVWMLPRVGVESPIRISDAADEVVVLNQTAGREAVVVGAQ